MELSGGEKLNEYSYRLKSNVGNVTVSTTKTSTPNIQSIENFFDGNYPYICPSYVKKDVAPTETTNRYRGKYMHNGKGCYSYDGIIKRGVSDVQIQLFISLRSRSPAGDPTNNRYNGDNIAYKNYNHPYNYKPVTGNFIRSDNVDLKYYCSIDNRDNLPANLIYAGPCPHISDIEKALRKSIEEQISEMAKKNISVWQAYSDEAYFGKEGKTLADRQVPATITLATSFEGLGYILQLLNSKK
jgi:hypothetical protein